MDNVFLIPFVIGMIGAYLFAVVLTVIAFSSIALTLDNFVISKLLQALEDQFGTAEEVASAIRTLFNLF